MDAKRDSWYAMPHREFREWTGVELGDTRQVYARDTRASRKAPLVFMPEGEARRFWRAAREGRLICPVPGCPDPRLTTRHGDDRRDHFVHRQAPGLRHADFPAEVTQQMLHRWAAGLDERLEVLDDQVVAGVKVTVLVRSVTGRQVALCYSSGALGAEVWQEQHAALERAGIAGVWLLPPRARYFSPPQAQPSPPGEEAEGLVLDTHLFKTMRREGSWPLIVNIEREEVANLIVPGKAVATRLGLPKPLFAEDVLHVVVSPLASCTLCKDGMASTAVNKWQLEKIREGYRKRMDRAHGARERVHSARREQRVRVGHADIPTAYRAYDEASRVRRAQQAQAPTANAVAGVALAERQQTMSVTVETPTSVELRSPSESTEREHYSPGQRAMVWLAGKLARIFQPRPVA